MCKTKVVESTVFDEAGSVSKTDVMSQLFIGALGPPNDSVPTAGDGFTAHIVGDAVDESTVFEVEDKGRPFFLKNVRSTVSLASGMGWEIYPKIFEAEDATVVNAVSLYAHQLFSTMGYIQLNNLCLLIHIFPPDGSK